MAFNIHTFRNAMHYDGQRPNLFEVTIPTTANLFNGDSLNLFAKATSIPGGTIGTVIVPYFGREVKMAGNRTFPEWTVTVINDENFAIRSQFEGWMHKINSHAANYRNAGTTSTSYTSTATVKQYGKSSSVSATYSFQNLFPTDLSEITLDWGDNDTIEEYTVTFSYDFWTRSAGSLSDGKGVVSDNITADVDTG